MNKKVTVMALIGVALILIGIMPLILAAEQSYCCEKTTSGAWCQNAPQEQCDSDFALSPTSCDSTGYCKEGCCFNRNDGTCSKNTPQKICEDSAGVWSSVPDCSIPQCGLGCCLIGDQAAFVSQTRCTHLASAYGLTVDYRSDITSELSCIAAATADVEGACVWKEGFNTKCERTTKEKCAATSSTLNSTFYDNYLCSHPGLGTDCGPGEETTCVEGLDQVYFLDTCGNLANVYDATRAKDETYWREIEEPFTACDLGIGFGNSNTCGNCDYYSGSTCKDYDSNKDIQAPTYGDKVCRDLGCEFDTNGNGVIDTNFLDYERYEHGETWCAQSNDASRILFGEGLAYNPDTENLPGTRYFRLVCYNGEVTIEPCADFKQEVCLEQKIPADNDRGFYSNAKCVANQWEDCVAQTEEDDCENTDLRDCYWYSPDDFNQLSKDDIILTTENNPDGLCVPRYAPGLNFWDSGSDADSQCSIASKTCKVEYTRGLTGGLKGGLGGGFEKTKWDATDNAQCDPDGSSFEDWSENRNRICYSMGDCGVGINYIGTLGYNDNVNDTITWTSKMDEEELSGE